MKCLFLTAVVASVFFASNAFGEDSPSKVYNKLKQEAQQEAAEQKRFNDIEYALKAKGLDRSNFRLEVTESGDVFLMSDKEVCRLIYHENIIIKNSASVIHYVRDPDWEHHMIPELNCYQLN